MLKKMKNCETLENSWDQRQQKIFWEGDERLICNTMNNDQIIFPSKGVDYTTRGKQLVSWKIFISRIFGE